MHIGVLASGGGTILKAILDSGIPVDLVVVDRPCGAIEVAEKADIPAILVERPSFGPSFDRLEYTERVVDALRTQDIELVVMAGFMTVLDKPIFDAWPGKIVNTHPALLPSFRGAHPVEDALATGVKVTGCTIHIATQEVDSGPILAQEAVPVLPDDTAQTLLERIKEVERRIYPATIKELIEQ